MAKPDNEFLFMTVSSAREFTRDGKDETAWDRVGVLFITLADNATARDKEDLERLIKHCAIRLDLQPLPTVDRDGKMQVNMHAFFPSERDDRSRDRGGRDDDRSGRGRDDDRSGRSRDDDRGGRGRDDDRGGRPNGGGRY